MKEIDARGLACPAPVLQVRAVLQKESPTHLKVIVDNVSSQQNVQRFLESQNFQTCLEQAGSNYIVTGNYDALASVHPHPATEIQDTAKKIMVMCSSNQLGSGDEMLGQKLMVNFLRTLKEMGDDLWSLVFVNNGVKLTIEGSDVLEDLKTYESAGLKILVCGTCLEHFSLLGQKRVGETTNMLDIVSAMQFADKVINM